MPCHDPFHSHDWPRSGVLSISKCEFKCGFCTSTKDYKPASALRKVRNHRIPEREGSSAEILMQHVLTHIKNDDMPIILEKSTGGRPRLWVSCLNGRRANRLRPSSQTTSIAPMIPDMPELLPSGSELIV